MSDTPVNQEAHDILIKRGWEFLSSTDGESGYGFQGKECTLIVSPSGAWRVIEPTSYSEHLVADGLPDELGEWLYDNQ